MNDDKYVMYGGDILGGEKFKGSSLADVLLSNLEDYGDQVAFVFMIDALTSQEISYKHILNESVKLAECLTAAGLKSGDSIALVSENRMEFIYPTLAGLLLGVIVAPINVTYTDREVHHAFSLSNPKLVFASPHNLKNVVNAAKSTQSIQHIVLFGDNLLNDKAILYNEFTNKYKQASGKPFQPAKVDLHNNISLILCSSGTTGLPKGVQLSYNNAVSVGIAFKSGMDRRRQVTGEQYTILGVMPWFHGFGCLTMFAAIVAGVKMIVMPKFDEKLYLSTIQIYKVNVLYTVPPTMVFLAKSPLVDKYDISSVRSIFCGAAPLSAELIKAASKRLHSKCTIRQGYGMTETTLGVLEQHSTSAIKPGSVGTLSRGAYAKVVDPETGKSLGPNQPGELFFKGSQIMKGYVGDNQANALTIDKDGWLHSGDIGYYDADKHFFIIDRLKELIKYKAFQVPPAELEAIILTNEKIKDAAVVGLPDESCGELPLAFVVKKSGIQVTEAEIIKYVEDRVSSAKRLRGGVRFLNEIPKSTTGKILRKELRDLLKETKSKL